ncbi:hypothetical protein NUW58_g9547 [Xylaria curta]|uniref:Uncharacterized protein n=1 Tax=Xylaria curta TaxID=42375 RepID=A0ACC1MVB5_9PEZI|nr:hypothetical protein NUW58_g9547 [Xylaria curta]
MSKFFTTATLVAAVQALAFDGKPARATDGVVPDATFHLPEITQAPEVDVRALLRRDTGDNTVLIGPDNTCGYVSGRPGAPITCNNDYTCAFIIQENFGRAGCCEGNDCGLRATCLDVRQVSRSCDNGCLQDTFTLKCTASSASYCNTVTFFSGVIDYYCGANNISTPQQLYTTYNGQTDAKPWQQVIVTPTASGGTGVNSASEDGSFFITFTSTRPSNTGSPSGSGNNGSGGNSGDNNNSGSGSGSGSNTDQPVQKQESTPVGPIVGGVVGGK